MALNAKALPKAGGNTGPKQAPLEPGGYPGRVVQVIDLGVQEQQPYQGQQKKPVHELLLGYELSDEFCKDEEGKDMEDKPRWLSETMPFYGLNQENAKSTLRYKAIDPEDESDGDFTRLIGRPCMINIIQKKGKINDTVYNNVQSVSSVRKKDADRMPPLVNEPKVFVLDNPDMDVFNALPSWIQEKIKKNLHYIGSPLYKALQGSTGNDSVGGGTQVAVEVDNGTEEHTGGSEDAPW